jgi:hypothetical protein
VRGVGRFVGARLEAALAAGGRIVDDSNARSWWTLADRAGNRVCVCVGQTGRRQQRCILGPAKVEGGAIA